MNEGKEMEGHTKSLAVERREARGGCWRGLRDQGNVCSDGGEQSDFKCWRGEGEVADTGERWGPEPWSHLFSGKEVRMGGLAGELGGSGRSFCNRVLFLCGREGTPLAGSEWSSRTISSVVRCG